MASDTWIGENYVDASGEWIEDKKPVQAQWKQQEIVGGISVQMAVIPLMVGNKLKVLGFILILLDICMNKGGIGLTENVIICMKVEQWHMILGLMVVMLMHLVCGLKICRHNGSSEGNRWWYQRADGSYPMNCWEKINDVWYHFDLSGWMQTGWIEIGGMVLLKFIRKLWLQIAGLVIIIWVTMV